MVDTTRRIVIEVDNTGARADIAQTDRAMTGLGRTADGVNNTFNRLSAAASAVAAALATSQIIAYADAWTVVNNRLANSVRESEALADVTERVFNIANDTRSSLDATAALYQSLERSTRELGVSTDDLATITTNLNRAFIVSGASAVDAENATRQLGQALAAGALRGDEYNSIAENGSRITIALADSLGVTVGELRELAAQGALTSDVFVDVFTSVETSTALLDEYGNVTATFAQQQQVANNNLTEFIGTSTTVQSAVSTAGSAIVLLSENLDEAVSVASTLAEFFAVRLVFALGSYAAAAATATTATTALSGALLLLGGPAGALAATVVGIAAVLSSTQDLDQENRTLRDSANQAAEAYKNLTEAQADNALQSVDRLIASQASEVQRLQEESRQATERFNQQLATGRESGLVVLQERAENAANAVRDANNELLRLGQQRVALAAVATPDGGDEIIPTAEDVEQISIESQLAYEQYYQSLRDARALQLEQNQIDNETELQQTYDLTLEQQLIYEEYYASLREAQAQSSSDLIAQEEAKNQALIALSGNLGTTLVSLANGNSRALFNIGKVAAIASATLAARTAIPEAYEQGVKIGGPPLGSIYAAVAATATAAQVAQVASTQFTSSGGVTSAGASSVAPTSPTTSTATPVVSTQNQRFVEIRGLPDDAVLSGSQVKDLVTELASSDDDIIVAISSGQSAGSREGLI